MPPLLGIERGIDGDMLKALEEIGHGAQIAVVDASYDIPEGAHVVKYCGDSSPRALAGIIALVPVDEDMPRLGGERSRSIVCMEPDDAGESGTVLEEFANTIPSDMILVAAKRNGDAAYREDSRTAQGFYAVANSPEAHTLFVRTRDPRKYGCAVFTVGHNQPAD